MKNHNQNIDVNAIIREYLEYCYNESPNSLVVAKDDIEMTVADWCKKYGGTPEKITNFEFINEKFDDRSELHGSCVEGEKYGDD